MTKTDIYFNLIDVTAKRDTTAEATDKQEFIDVNDFKLEGVTAPKVTTLETDYWKLDGTFECFPDNPQNTSWGLWSKSMSGSDKKFSVPIVLIFNFSELHSVIGISFEFNQYDNSYCTNMNIKYYNGEKLLSDTTVYPDNWRYAYENKVENFNKLVLTFYGMNKADRYLKLQSVIHGLIKKFDEDTVIAVNLLEETDLTSNELTVNTMDFTIYSSDDDFNIFNPQGIYNTLQKKQQISVIGNINGSEKTMGVFYLDEWTAEENKMMSLSTVDAVGLMDGTYFKGGIYSNITADELIETVMNDAGFGYSLDKELSGIKLSGWLPYCTHREALQQIAIALGAYVDTSRGGTVKIKAQPDLDSDYVYILNKNRKHTGSKVNLKSYVTGVNLTEHNYEKNTAIEKLYSDTLDAGSKEIIFDTPVSVSAVTGATLVESGANYCIVDVETEGTVTIKGYKYNDNTQIISVNLDNINAGEKENVLSITNATLVTGSNSQLVANRILYQYQSRIEQTLTFTLDNEVIGSVANVEVLDNTYRKGIITKLETDLVNGFVTKAVVIGE
nr:MAG TPA: hypothetical protein [Caudoviricetes sp.]